VQEKKLTFTESLMLVTGAGVGTGILTIPYAVDKIGVIGTFVALLVAYAASAALYLIIADLARNSSYPGDFLAILSEHLFSEGRRKRLSLLFLVLLVLLLLENLVVYLMCAGDVLSDLTGMDSKPAVFLFYGIATAVIMFGVKGMGWGEKVSVFLIGCVVLVLTALSLTHVKGTLNVTLGKGSVVMAVYGLFMFAFSAIFAVLQVCEHIEKPELTRRALLGGLTLNALLTVLFAFAVILGSKEVTEVATIGLSDGVGMPVVKVLCSLLVVFAMISSFWSSGIAFADVVGGEFETSPRKSWLIATLPAALIAIVIPLSVLDVVQIGAGALSIILVLVVLPAYKQAMRDPLSPLLLGKHSGSKVLIAFVAAAVILMAISSFIPIR